MDGIEHIARALYLADKARMTGREWDWNKASEEVKAKYLARAGNGERPPMPHEI